jgi:hypothetical protein
MYDVMITPATYIKRPTVFFFFASGIEARALVREIDQDKKNSWVSQFKGHEKIKVTNER